MRRKKLWIVIVVVVSLIAAWLLVKPRLIVCLQGSYLEELERRKKEQVIRNQEQADELNFQDLLDEARPLEERDLKCLLRDDRDGPN